MFKRITQAYRDLDKTNLSDFVSFCVTMILLTIIAVTLLSFIVILLLASLCH